MKADAEGMVEKAMYIMHEELRLMQQKVQAEEILTAVESNKLVKYTDSMVKMGRELREARKQEESLENYSTEQLEKLLPEAVQLLAAVPTDLPE